MKKYILSFLFSLFFYQNYIAAKPQVVFIHGMFLSKDCWNDWEIYFRIRGYQCINIAWPNKEMIAMSQRTSDNHPEIAAMTLTSIVNYYDSIISNLEEPPYLIGHSMGGLIVQKLLERGKGRAGVVIHSAPPHGIKLSNFKYIKSNWPTLNPQVSNKHPYLMKLKRYSFSIANQLSKKEQHDTWRRYMMYESMLVWRAPLHKESTIDYGKKTQPLLFISGGKDRITPAKLNKKNYIKYKKRNKTITEYKMFKNRGHMVLMEKNWQEVADFVMEFLGRS